MTDITKITAPFGLLDKATQDELQAASEWGAKMEVYTINGWVGWEPEECDGWYSSGVYRVKPEPVRVSEIYDFYTVNPMTFAGRHRITCNPDGTDPTVTWEPSE